MARHNELGKLGELVAARYLMNEGYIILARNWRCNHLEIDIVCKKDNVIAFVEVKTRSTNFFGEPEDAIDRKKIRNLINAATIYIGRNHKHSSGEFRFDIISVVGKCEPFKITHFPDAINPFSQIGYYT